MATIKQVMEALENWAPLMLQESYDNAGLIVGDSSHEVQNALISLDCTEEVVEEAVQKNANLIICHHPIVFKGLKSFTGKTYVERTVMKAIKNDIAIYASHTNLDSVHTGVNMQIGKVLGMENMQVLSPKKGVLNHLTFFVPTSHLEEVRQAVFQAGAGTIGNYSGCGFSSDGEGTFIPNENAQPFVGQAHKVHKEKEKRVEVMCNREALPRVITAMKIAHPYEEVAYYVTQLENEHQQVGFGMIGDLKQEMDVMEFLQHVKTKMDAGVVKYTKPIKKQVLRIAWCGGAGSFLLKEAKRQGADIFLTSDFKYHEFFDAENQIVIADIGHYETEQYTNQLISDFLSEKFSTFANRISEINTNPVNYL